MLPIESPFKTYTGLDGKPLDNGYVYFGEPDQDPIAHPVTVYWDAAGTIPALQPLRTVNGYIMRSGTPANVFYAGAYSELVRDSKSRLVAYAPTSDGFSIASYVDQLEARIDGLADVDGTEHIGFQQSGDGAVLRTSRSKLRELISAIDWGAVGDGAADDTAKLQAMFDNCDKKLNGTIYEARVHIPAGVYKITSRILIPTTDGQNVRWFIEGDGPLQTKIFQQTLGEPVFDVSETIGTAGNQSVIMNLGMSGPAGTGQSHVGAESALIFGHFFIGWRFFNCWFTSSYYGIRMTDADATPTVGCEELYVGWCVFEFIQNPIAANGVTTSIAITKRAASGNVATLTTATPHGLAAGQKVGVRGMASPAYCQSNIQVLAVPSPTTFTYRVGAVGAEAETADTTGRVYWLNARSVHLAHNEFASVARTDIGGLGSDAAINLNAVESVTLTGNRYAYGVGKGLIAVNCRDIVISGEDFSMANESINASLGAFGHENMTFINSTGVTIGPCLYSTNIAGANVLLQDGSKVNISGGYFSNVAGNAAVKASGAFNELVLTGATIDNVSYAAIEVDSKASLINSVIRGNKVGAMGPNAKMVNMLAGVLDSTVVVEGNFPDTLWAAIEGRWNRSFPLQVTAAGTVPLAVVNLLDYGTAVVTMRANGLSQNDGAAGYEIRYSLHRTLDTTTITQLGDPLSFGSVPGEAQMAAIASGNQTQLRAVFSSTYGFTGMIDIEVIGAIATIDRLY